MSNNFARQYNPEAEQDIYRILSGNIRQDVAINEPEVALADIQQAIEAYQPDLICLQEAVVAERGDRTSGYLGRVASTHQMDTEFVQTTQYRRRNGSIHSGLANLIKPTLKTETTEVQLSKSRTNPLRPVRQRTLLVSSICEEGKRPLHVVNAHLSYATGINRRQRREEWQKIFESVGSLDGDVVVTGDFNAGPKSSLVQMCNELWQPISDQSLPTWHNIKEIAGRLPRFSRTLDYVFTNKDCYRKTTVTPLSKGSSDHIWQIISIEQHPNREN